MVAISLLFLLVISSSSDAMYCVCFIHCQFTVLKQFTLVTECSGICGLFA